MACKKSYIVNSCPSGRDISVKCSRSNSVQVLGSRESMPITMHKDDSICYYTVIGLKHRNNIMVHPCGTHIAWYSIAELKDVKKIIVTEDAAHENRLDCIEVQRKTVLKKFSEGLENIRKCFKRDHSSPAESILDSFFECRWCCILHVEYKQVRLVGLGCFFY